MFKALAIFLAYLLDLAIGDPYWQWHPVRLIGGLISELEKKLNAVILSSHSLRSVQAPSEESQLGNLNKKLSGILLVILVIGATAFSVWFILKLSSLVHPFFYFIIYGLLIYFSLSVKSLADEANQVYAALNRGDIVGARENLSKIVARDTQALDEREIIRATVETVAESTMDGIIAPLFYAFLGGPVLAWAYKAVNTLDSMVGYTNEKFAQFGWSAAKLDAWVNLVPAKLTSLAIFISGYLCGHYRKESRQWLVKYFFQGPKYNSESTEAVMASVLGVRLGGVNFYHSVAVQKNFIADEVYPLETKHISQSIKIAYVASGVFVAIGIFLVWII